MFSYHCSIRTKPSYILARDRLPAYFLSYTPNLYVSFFIFCTADTTVLQTLTTGYYSACCPFVKQRRKKPVVPCKWITRGSFRCKIGVIVDGILLFLSWCLKRLPSFFFIRLEDDEQLYSYSPFAINGVILVGLREVLDNLGRLPMTSRIDDAGQREHSCILASDDGWLVELCNVESLCAPQPLRIEERIHERRPLIKIHFNLEESDTCPYRSIYSQSTSELVIEVFSAGCLKFATLASALAMKWLVTYASYRSLTSL